jgi:GNAT superfamily N-acetyltransferase
MKVTLKQATKAQVTAIVKLRTATNEKLTRDFGHGPWTSTVTEKGILFNMRNGRVYVAREGQTIIGSLLLTAKKPWAINRSYFSKSERPLYLLAMAITPDQQRKGVGRAMLEEVKRIVKGWPGDAIRLDAYDLPGGAGEFYARCGYREMGRVIYRGAPLIYYELLLS